VIHRPGCAQPHVRERAVSAHYQGCGATYGPVIRDCDGDDDQRGPEPRAKRGGPARLAFGP
jgi:hypothetical protein